MLLAHSSQGHSQTEAVLKVSFIQAVKNHNCPVSPQKKEWTPTNTPSQEEKFSNSVKIVVVSVFPVHSRANQVSTGCASQLCADQAAHLLTVDADNETFSGPESGTSFNGGD